GDADDRRRRLADRAPRDDHGDRRRGAEDRDVQRLQPARVRVRCEGDDQGPREAGERRGEHDQQPLDLHRLLHAQLMHLSSNAAAWIAIGAAVAALAALAIALLHFLTLRRVRAAQLALVGDGKADLVDFAVALQRRIDGLHGAVDEVGAALAGLQRRVDETVSKTAIVRYDAYEN